MLQAVMYHYVSSFNEELPFFKNLHIEDFKKQLDYFEKKFGFVSKQDFLESFTTGILPKGIILTFDDGLKCHYEYVFHELKKRNLWGIFYIPTAPYKNGKLLDVHRIHLLLGKCSGYEVYIVLEKIVTDDMLSDSMVKDFHELTYHLQDNDNYTQLVKRILNYFISYEFREAVIDRLMEVLVPDSLNAVQQFYLSHDEIDLMSKEGMLIGSHTVSHPVMSKLNSEEQKKEIKESFRFLHSVTNTIKVNTFCYPYGGFHSFTNETEELLSEESCLFSFNVEHRDITENDVLRRPQALPRYDCNIFPYGKCRN